MNDFTLDFFNKELLLFKKKGLIRELKGLKGRQGPSVKIDGKKVLMLSSNNYLGLSSHPIIKKAFIEAAEIYGIGACASRLISGNSELYSKLEEKVSIFKSVDSTIVFSSGYMANLGLLSAICVKGDLILCDKLSHASIIDGCLMSKADFKRYPHKDLDSLEKILKREKSSYKKIVIITDGIFSMDGDIAPIPDLITIAKKYSALLVIDEAHGIGILGKKGKGLLEYFNKNEDESIISIGTFGKAFGTYGAYISGKKAITDFLINKSRNLIYTTALPPSILAASIASVDLVSKSDDLRINLNRNANYLSKALTNLGFNIMDSNTHIIPVILGNADRTMSFSKKLFEQGIFVQGIRPPTVPVGSSRLRITVMADHTISDLDYVIDVFNKIKKELGAY